MAKKGPRGSHRDRKMGHGPFDRKFSTMSSVFDSGYQESGRRPVDIASMSTAFLFELDVGLARISGLDARTFLHNQLTCDVMALQVGRSTYGAYCTPKGRMLASFLLWRSGEADFHLQLPAPLREPIQKQLAKYILRAKVQAADASGDWTLAGIAGGGAGDAVRRATGLHPESPHDVAIGPHAMVIRLPGERYEVAAARDKAAAI